MALNLDELLTSNTEETKSNPKETEKVSEKNKETVGSKETVSTSGNKTKKPVKKKGKPRGGNSPVIGNNGLMLEEGDNAKFMGVQIALLNMPDIDMDNVSEVQQRLSDYFELYTSRDMKPTVAGMAVALNGHSRQWLRAVVIDGTTGGSGYKAALRPEVANLIKKAYFMLENLWETYMSSGKVNPVAGIFLGKNNYGYQDKTEYVLTPNQQNDNDYDADEIRDRYIAADQQKRLSDNSTIDEDQSD
jgi:hypothetical protein